MCKVNVIGLGYIGLPTALSMAANGIEVIGTDVNSGLIEKLNNNQLTFEEPGLGELFRKAKKGRIAFTTQYQTADVYIVSVPTPYVKENKRLDPGFLVGAVNRILEIARKGQVIVIESTISPGTIDKVVRPLLSSCPRLSPGDIQLVHAPERILPGNMLYELANNPRTIGADDPATGEGIRGLYSRFCKSDITVTDIRTAEMSKVVENTYRDINIAFANELAKICRADGMDVYEIIRIANRHPRVNILQPGPGVGGHCISVDPWFLVGDYPGLANIILTARKINDSMPEFVLERTFEIMKENNIWGLEKVGFYGLTYKENVDDVRESPTLQLLGCMERHLAFGARVYDPFVKRKIVDNQCFDLREFLDGIDLVVVMVAHDEIKQFVDIFKEKIVLDTRNVLEDSFYKL